MSILLVSVPTKSNRLLKKITDRNVIDGHLNEIMETALVKKGYTTTVCKGG